MDGGSREEEEWVCASMLGSLGRFGNQLIQLAACMALAEAQGLRLMVPWGWQRRIGCLFCGGAAADDDDDDEDATADGNGNGSTGPPSAPPLSRWRSLPDHEAWALPIVSDRVVLSHPGFRTWIATREPYVSLAAAAGTGGALSGRQLRRLFPQATVADLKGVRSNIAADPPASRPPPPPPPPLAGRGLWGWFQWPSGALTPFASRLVLSGPRAPLRLRPRLARALDAAVDALVYTRGKRRRKKRRFVAVHVRRGDFSAGPAAASAAVAGGRPPALLRTEPPFEVESGESWDDQGLCWRTPVEWLRPALEEAVAALTAAEAEGGAVVGTGGEDGGDKEEGEEEEEQSPLVVLCTDDPDLARDPAAVWPGAVTWARPGLPEQDEQENEGGALAAALDGARAALAACRRRPGGDDDDDDSQAAAADLHMLLDWRLMQRVDALLASNSTFSFTAALLRSPSPSSPSPSSDGDAAAAATSSGLRPVFLRPCPQAGAFVAFDPWDSLPLLPSRPNLPANHGARQQQQQRT